MGLDMYLRGRKFHWTDWKDESKNTHEEGFRVSGTELELGYWRKHPNLHGYIVQTFAGGVDECQEIDLDREDIEKIIAAIKADALPTTTGFFFGASDPDYDAESIAILEKALKWLDTKVEMRSKSIIYRASW